MADVGTVLEELKSKGNEKTRVILSRHGIPIDRTFGVSNADLKVIAKGIKGQQELAYELFATGNVDAMYLAGIVAVGTKFDRDRLDAWAKGADGIPMIAEHTVAWVTTEHPAGRELAVNWIQSGDESLAQCGWRAYSGIVTTTPDDQLDLTEVRRLLDLAVSTIHSSPNRVRSTMNSFVITVGTYVPTLLNDAKAAAAKIGVVSIDVGDTACKVRNAAEEIEKMEKSGQVGKKRKTIRC
jgi:3-methyladenine DNA glycosylase AlkD